jgi:hypothetical protein
MLVVKQTERKSVIKPERKAEQFTIARVINTTNEDGWNKEHVFINISSY